MVYPMPGAFYFGLRKRRRVSMYYLKTEQSFDSAHFLMDYNGKCQNLNGHRWRVVVEIKGDKLNEEQQTKGMLVDFRGTVSYNGSGFSSHGGKFCKIFL